MNIRRHGDHILKLTSLQYSAWLVCVCRESNTPRLSTSRICDLVRHFNAMNEFLAPCVDANAISEMVRVATVMLWIFQSTSSVVVEKLSDLDFFMDIWLLTVDPLLSEDATWSGGWSHSHSEYKISRLLG